MRFFLPTLPLSFIGQKPMKANTKKYDPVQRVCNGKSVRFSSSTFRFFKLITVVRNDTAAAGQPANGHRIERQPEYGRQ